MSSAGNVRGLGGVFVAGDLKGEEDEASLFAINAVPGDGEHELLHEAGVLDFGDRLQFASAKVADDTPGPPAGLGEAVEVAEALAFERGRLAEFAARHGVSAGFTARHIYLDATPPPGGGYVF